MMIVYCTYNLKVGGTVFIESWDMVYSQIVKVRMLTFSCTKERLKRDEMVIESHVHIAHITLKSRPLPKILQTPSTPLLPNLCQTVLI